MLATEVRPEIRKYGFGYGFLWNGDYVQFSTRRKAKQEMDALLKERQSVFSRGQTVTVYTDPVTRAEVEGEARLSSFSHTDGIFDCWYVLFNDSWGGPVLRKLYRGDAEG